MATRTTGTIIPRTSSEDRRALAERMRAVHISRTSELPRIELYLDQLLTLVSMELEFMAVPGETLVTGSMVNNYVKQGVIPAPHKKRYTRRHVAALIFVCAFKRVFSISQVKDLMTMVYSSGRDLAQTYDDCCDLFERALDACFSPEGLAEAAQDVLAPLQEFELDTLLEAAISALAAKVYVEQTLLQGAQRS